MTDSNYDDFFDGVGGGGAPSFKFGGIGTGIKGIVVDQYKTQVTDPSGNKKTYDDGQPIPQLNVTLKTDLRNWAGIDPDKIPKDPETQQPLPPEADEGERRIYVKYDMRRAVATAVKGAKAPGLRNGGVLAVKKVGEKPTGKGNPLPLYEARYQAPQAGDAFFEETPAAPPASAPAQQDTSLPAGGWGDEPPF